MPRILRGLGILLIALAIVPFLTELHLPFGLVQSGVALARGGGGGGGGGDSGGGGHDGSGGDHGGGHSGGGGDHDGGFGGRDADSGDSMAGHADSTVAHDQADLSSPMTGNEVSEAATSTAHAGKAEALEDGFPNLGKAVATAVHNAQRDKAGEATEEATEMQSLDAR